MVPSCLLRWTGAGYWGCRLTGEAVLADCRSALNPPYGPVVRFLSIDRGSGIDTEVLAE